MQSFLVGGAVRDRLLGRTIKDRDFVVVGGTPEEMEAQGYRRVGADFPVFLHPETGEEYALARTERSTGPGHTDFAVSAEPGVTLQEDLRRRDLTINAMAEDADGRLIDPYGGRQDLREGVLRHVSDAFREDPLRVLRVARFAARLSFRVAPETEELMRSMVEPLPSLPGERIRGEVMRALAEPHSSLFFRTLLEVGALQVILPELLGPTGDADTDDAMPLQWGLAALEQMRGSDAKPRALLAATLHAVHTRTDLDTLCDRLRVSNDVRRLVRIVHGAHRQVRRLFEMKSAEEKHALLLSLELDRRSDLKDDVLAALDGILRGTNTEALRPSPEVGLITALQAASDGARRAPNEAGRTPAEQALHDGLTGPAVHARIIAAQLDAISRVSDDQISKNR